MLQQAEVLLWRAHQHGHLVERARHAPLRLAPGGRSRSLLAPRRAPRTTGRSPDRLRDGDVGLEDVRPSCARLPPSISANGSTGTPQSEARRSAVSESPAGRVISPCPATAARACTNRSSASEARTGSTSTSRRPSISSVVTAAWWMSASIAEVEQQRLVGGSSAGQLTIDAAQQRRQVRSAGALLGHLAAETPARRNSPIVRATARGNPGV